MDLPKPGIKPGSLALQANSYSLSHQGSPIHQIKHHLISAQPSDQYCRECFAILHWWLIPNLIPFGVISLEYLISSDEYQKLKTWAPCSLICSVTPAQSPIELEISKYLLLLLLSCFSRGDSVRPHRRQPTRLPRPWNSPGKNTGVGCYFLPQCMKVKSESEVAKSCLTLSDPMDCSLPGSSVHGIFQARVLEWGAIAFSE